MKRKLLSVVLTLAMATATIISLPGSVYGAAPTSKHITGAAEESDPTAVKEVDGSGTVNTNNDWKSETDITVNGEIKGNAGYEIRYDIEIAYGDMKFVYDHGGRWDSTTHTYKPQDTLTTAGWVESYVNGSATGQIRFAGTAINVFNNSIIVINHSNYPVDAELTYSYGKDQYGYALSYNELFNKSTSDTDLVNGSFGANKADLWTNIAAKDTGRSGETTTTTMNLKSLDTAHNTGFNTSTYSAAYGQTFFTLYGTPTKDAGTGTAGNINVKISVPTP